MAMASALETLIAPSSWAPRRSGWHVAAGDALDGVAAGHFAGKHGGLGGLHGEDADLGVGGAEGAAAAGERAAGAVAGDEGVDESVHLRKDFAAGVFLVVLGVDGILELAREENARVAGGHLTGRSMPVA